MAHIRSALSIRMLVAIVGALAACFSVLLMHETSASGHSPVARAAAARCPAPYPAKRDPSNPLDLPSAPGANPLNGAHFMDPGPARGNYAAAAIAQLLGVNVKNLPPDETWATFAQEISTGRLSGRLQGDPALAKKVDQLALIA